MMRKTIQVAVAALFVFSSLTANASDTEAQFENHIQQFANVLNKQQDPEALVNFLHESVDQDAQIVMKLDGDAKPKEVPDMLTVGKVDYINNFLYGTRRVRDYRAEIVTQDIQFDAETNRVVAKYVLKETGMVFMRPGDYTRKSMVPFESSTNCVSHYDVSDKDTGFVLQTEACETQLKNKKDV